MTLTGLTDREGGAIRSTWGQVFAHASTCVGEGLLELMLPIS